MPSITCTIDDVETCVDAVLTRVGKKIVLGLPVGIGKPNTFVNALIRRAVADSSIRLSIYTALSFVLPRARSDLERRFLNPFLERVFEHYPELEYVRLLEQGSMPNNIEVSEFFLNPGLWLHNDFMQQRYMSVNYTHVVRDLLKRGVNVIAQLIAAPAVEDGTVSLSCNPDLTVDLLPHIQALREANKPFALVGQIHRELPYMYGDAIVPRTTFDFILDDARADYPLFAPPNLPLGATEHMIAAHVAALVRDDGTLQIGIGEMGDAVVYALKFRHEHPSEFAALLRSAGALEDGGDLIRNEGGIDSFAHGLYGCTEMFVDGFLELYRAGILKRRVYDGALPQGILVHGCFFFGPRRFYSALREMPEDERRQFAMQRISFVNELYGNDQELKIAQRRHARFVNTTMMVTGLGAAVSDGLADGRVVSGVGGQYNFVAMAHALPDARSILCVRSTRAGAGQTTSNIVWNYAHTTIPRHLRDIVITEYGIADLRGRTDEEIVRALVNVMDARFQDAFVAEAKQSGKLQRNYRVPDHARHNTPAHLEALLKPLRQKGLFPEFPFGSEFTEEEIEIARALKLLQLATATKGNLVKTIVKSLFASKSNRDLSPYLKRLQLDKPTSMAERIERNLVAWALQR